MDNEKMWQLLILKLSGEASGEELAELELLLRQHPDLAQQAASVESIWKSKGAPAPADTDHLFNRHLQRLSDGTADNTPFQPIPDVRRRTSGTQRIFFIAASLAAAAVIAIVLFNALSVSGNLPNPATPAVSGNSVSTKNGSKSKLQLPDGTQVWLNSGSNISYENDFGSASRQVRLIGEAFFDVVKDPSRPFVIHTATIDIKVLGTAFNVRSYPEEKITETALIRGAVEITLKASTDKKIVLKPNEKLVVSNDSSWLSKDSAHAVNVPKKPAVMTLTQVHHLDKDSIATEMLWTKNKLVFDGETLSEVALKLERWYGVKVIIIGDELKNIEYTGVFSDDNLTEVLYALQLSGNFKYVIRRNEVIIRP
ncbi:FecR domain-containing protein [Flavitalea sp. BT771]|uniref:FecR family protein n=1 Tax=Flavitalea sp. BT771 TaxID=3063329 RepID=UPI0026E32A3D|nr:FecR domain-containing protein [Flavitalea sp. BT771]MDO6430433.1 FecR domain-containing protein [Flavitalea sp. BT771]MDV6219427.1 FecR domain-containing protein [Flavitalea sp. BT771]